MDLQLLVDEGRYLHVYTISFDKVLIFKLFLSTHLIPPYVILECRTVAHRTVAHQANEK